ncbi:MAG: hypothetical protein ACLGH0_15270 [Thermoanaerobaculia bacterium]
MTALLLAVVLATVVPPGPDDVYEVINLRERANRRSGHRPAGRALADSRDPADIEWLGRVRSQLRAVSTEAKAVKQVMDRLHKYIPKTITSLPP